MLWNPDDFEQARQARDPHFDGRVFIGVLSTGIYCRPICPVRIPRKENIRLYDSAAAAAEAGFRPCLRCRPESAPGTPAWMGSSHTVARALQMISSGLLQEGSVPALAAALGIGERQVSRLFQQHLGVSVLAVANTQRLHFAKKLIDETRLPMSNICFAAGFGSIRRFNAVFRNVYGRAPSALRKLRVEATNSLPVQEDITLRLNYRPPFDWHAMLAYLASRAIPGVECVTSDAYSRTIMLNGVPAEFHVQFVEGTHHLLLRIQSSHTRALQHVVERVKVMFDLKAVSADIERHLCADPLLKTIVDTHRGMRIPVAWDGFEVAVRAIIGQQVSVKAATTLVSRLAKTCGNAYASASNPQLTRVFPDPSLLTVASLSGLGITTRRIVAIQQLANAVMAGELRFDGSQDTPRFLARITQIPGIGLWTAQYIALRALNDPDAFPHNDLILLRAAAAPGETLTPGQLLTRAESWRPWRGYAVMLLWRHYAHIMKT